MGSDWEFRKLALINDIVLQVTITRKTCTNFSGCRQDTFGTLVLYCSVNVYVDMQQNCLELQKNSVFRDLGWGKLWNRK